MAASQIVCGHCEYQNVLVQAVNMCHDCDEGYCKDCSNTHGSMKATRHHKLVPKDEQQSEYFRINTMCQEHGKKLDFFCVNHDDVACVKCVSAYHRSCDKLTSIEEAAQNVISSPNFLNLEENISSMVTCLAEMINENIENAQSIKKQKSAIQNEIHVFKNKILKQLDDFESQLLATLDSKYQEAKTKLVDSSIALKQFKVDFDEMKQSLEKIKEYSNVQVFLSVRNLTKLLTSHQNEVRTNADSLVAFDFLFEKKKETGLMKELSFGEICVSRKQFKTTLYDPTSNRAQYIKDHERDIRHKENMGIPGTNLKTPKPESAELLCQLDYSEFTELQPGEKVLLVDFGSGTVKVTVHVLQHDKSFQEIDQVSNGPRAEIKVYDNFCEYLLDLFGLEAITKLTKNEVKELETNFESFKKTITVEERVYFISIPLSLRKIAGPSTVVAGKLKLDSTVVKGFFERPVKNICHHIAEVISSLIFFGLETLVLVGGFAECPALQQEIKNQFPSMRIKAPVKL